jgi:hypothetical protein
MTSNFSFFARTQFIRWPEPVIRDFEENKFYMADIFKDLKFNISALT